MAANRGQLSERAKNGGLEWWSTGLMDQCNSKLRFSAKRIGIREAPACTGRQTRGLLYMFSLQKMKKEFEPWLQFHRK
jgi:hypothetical protein